MKAIETETDGCYAIVPETKAEADGLALINAIVTTPLDELVCVDVQLPDGRAEPRIMTKSDAVQLCPSCKVEWTTDDKLEVARLRKALAFYADAENYREFGWSLVSLSGAGEPPPVLADCGAQARKALETT